jgi:hypothetical protein
MKAASQAKLNIADSEHASLVSTEVADWTREQPLQLGEPGRKLLLAHRRYQYWRQRRRYSQASSVKI